ncbi:hypothetical protein TRIP_B210042 [uncultured Desulfatiglans sp.]|uniref:Uncharacterized protein n=1 Tax=Uncultured Desulfatiglans sp. TaxID=1748965 RepID=A0A653A3V8_UNCDX|nr:hypothetical protein TRIP_B210042 [uncultured Desulfatiglans sp.]
MVFLANLGVNLHVCLCGDLQVASAQTLDFLDIGQKSSFPHENSIEPSGNGLFGQSRRQSARLLVRRPAGRCHATDGFD